MTSASSVALSAAAVRAVADGATPSSLTASVAASLSVVGILIDVLDVSALPLSSSWLIRSTASTVSTTKTVPRTCGTVCTDPLGRV